MDPQPFKYTYIHTYIYAYMHTYNVQAVLFGDERARSEAAPEPVLLVALQHPEERRQGRAAGMGRQPNPDSYTNPNPNSKLQFYPESAEQAVLIAQCASKVG